MGKRKAYRSRKQVETFGAQELDCSSGCKGLPCGDFAIIKYGTKFMRKKVCRVCVSRAKDHKPRKKKHLRARNARYQEKHPPMSLLTPNVAPSRMTWQYARIVM